MNNEIRNPQSNAVTAVTQDTIDATVLPYGDTGRLIKIGIQAR